MSDVMMSDLFQSEKPEKIYDAAGMNPFRRNWFPDITVL